MPIKHLATPYQELHVFQALCCYPHPDFAGGKWRDSKHLLGNSGLMTNSAVVPIPRRPLRDNHLFFSLATELNLLGSVCLTPSPITTTKSKEKRVTPLLLKVRKAPVLRHTLLCLVPATLHFHFSTGHSVLYRCHYMARFEVTSVCAFSWWRLYLKQHRAPARSRQGVRTQQENKSLLYGREILTKEPFCSAWGWKRKEKENSTHSKGFTQYLQPA